MIFIDNRMKIQCNRYFPLVFNLINENKNEISLQIIFDIFKYFIYKFIN